MTAVAAALGLVVLLLGALVVGLLRSHAEILRALHELGVDLEPTGAQGSAEPAAAPRAPTITSVPSAVSGIDPDGGAIAASLRGEDRLTLLAFLSSGCLTCRPMWEALADPSTSMPGGARLIAVTKGPHEESPSSIAAVASPQLTTIMSSEAWTDFAVPGSPFFVLVDGTGHVVGQGTASSWSRVAQLMEEALGDAERGAATPQRRPRGGEARRKQIDDALRAAGVEAGHPSLHPDR